MLVFNKLKHDDIIEIEKIEKISFSKPWTREMFEKELLFDKSWFFCVKKENIIVGYGCFRSLGSDADIITLCVHPDHRHKGYGREILDFLCLKAAEEGVKRIMLEVRKNNCSAQSLYLSHGFVSLGTRSRYYGDEDALVMEKNI